jgi:hypothetical protein
MERENELMNEQMMSEPFCRRIVELYLRSGLVDYGYLVRNPDGSRYEVAAGSKPQLFDPEIEQVDVLQVIQVAREEFARRKREYFAKLGRRE